MELKGVYLQHTQTFTRLNSMKLMEKILHFIGNFPTLLSGVYSQKDMDSSNQMKGLPYTGGYADDRNNMRNDGRNICQDMSISLDDYKSKRSF
ncbi:MAG: hypothetical protein JWN78_1489 [Bacteroidota bacterium]|nr:hypothetical protein [Bacteroidota bacterium]